MGTVPILFGTRRASDPERPALRAAVQMAAFGRGRATLIPPGRPLAPTRLPSTALRDQATLRSTDSARSARLLTGSLPRAEESCPITGIRKPSLDSQEEEASTRYSTLAGSRRM